MRAKRRELDARRVRSLCRSKVGRASGHESKESQAEEETAMVRSLSPHKEAAAVAARSREVQGGRESEYVLGSTRLRTWETNSMRIEEAFF